jgi:uncharacterized membrane protein
LNQPEPETVSFKGMTPKKTKYDTNPLDPDYVKETEEVWGEEGASRTDKLPGATQPVQEPNQDPRANLYSEAPTRRIDDPPLDAPYPSIFVPPTYAPPVQTAPRPPQYAQQPHRPGPSDRPVQGIGLPEKWAAMLPYTPFYIGLVASLLELFLVPRNEGKVRFHAAQGLSIHIAILAIQTIFGVVGSITDSSIGGTLFKIGATIFLVISMIRAWKDEPHRIAALSDSSEWFNQRIEPRKPS